MEGTNHYELPTLTANMKTLRQQLEELYADAKATSATRQTQADQAPPVGMVIKGK